jgi:nicotinate-nucleotide adenylyltransferase
MLRGMSISNLLFIFILLLMSAGRAQTRVGLYTGTFDPPHLGHRRVILDAIEKAHLDVLLVATNPLPGKKPNAVSFDQRLEMVQIAFSNLPRVKVMSRDELNQLQQLDIVPYLSKLGGQNPDGFVLHVMGTDNYEKLAAQKIPLPTNEILVISPRSEEEAKLIPPMLGKNPIIALPYSEESTSSTVIRNLINQQKDTKDHLSPKVREFIDDHHLYGPAAVCRALFAA